MFFNKCESHVDIVGDFYVFNPSVGSQLTGNLLIISSSSKWNIHFTSYLCIMIFPLFCSTNQSCFLYFSQGIVNKVNQGQIGCLTHGLFNISLPKPFALPIQSWLGSSVKIHDEILFTIIKVDFGSHVPYIQGNIEEVR